MRLTRHRHSARHLSLALWAGLTMSACATGTNPPQLAGTEWRLSSIGDEAALPQPAATLVFGSDGRITGHGSCNRFFGPFQLAADRMTVGAIASTRMGCPGPVGQQESRYLQTLQGVAQVQQQDGTLLIRSENDGTVLRFLPLRP